MSVYYNEIDEYAAEWLRNLIARGLIAAGDVDTRDIRAVPAEDLQGYRQHHFFAGIGGWSYALRLAGWGDDRPIWTGSCPCQPLSGAGRRQGHVDERHLWPAFYALIAERRPATIFGEQVDSPDGREWLAGVRADLEGDGYAVGAASLCGPTAGAPHRRLRLYWVANANTERREGERLHLPRGQARPADDEAGRGREAGGVGDACGIGGGRHTGAVPGTQGEGEGEGETLGRVPDQPQPAGDVGRMGNPLRKGLPLPEQETLRGSGGRPEGRAVEQSGDADGMADADGGAGGQRSPVGSRRDHRGGTDERAGSRGGRWTDFDLAHCRDGTVRRVEPGTFPLAYGIPKDMGRGRPRMERMAIRAARAWRSRTLRGYGNAIIPQVAAEFVKAFMECAP